MAASLIRMSILCVTIHPLLMDMHVVSFLSISNNTEMMSLYMPSCEQRVFLYKRWKWGVDLLSHGQDGHLKFLIEVGTCSPKHTFNFTFIKPKWITLKGKGAQPYHSAHWCVTIKAEVGHKELMIKVKALRELLEWSKDTLASWRSAPELWFALGW